MKRLFKLFHRGEKGFTLIELLTILSILGVIAAIAISAVGGLIVKGQDESALTERDNVQLAVTAAMADVQIGELNPGEVTNAPNNTVTYGNGTDRLPIGGYITGGLESLHYSYSVARDGKVSAINGPLAI